MLTDGPYRLGVWTDTLPLHTYLQMNGREKNRFVTVKTVKTRVIDTEGALHELNQMVNLLANHLVKCRRVARDPNPRLKLT